MATLPLTVAELESWARAKMATLPLEVQNAAVSYVTLASSYLLERQMDEFKWRLLAGLCDAIPKAAEKLKSHVEKFEQPTKLHSDGFTAVELRPEHFGVGAWKASYATGKVAVNWNCTMADKIYVVIVGIKDPQQSSVARILYGSLGVDNLPTYDLEQPFHHTMEPLVLKALPKHFLIPPQTQIELMIENKTAGYSALQPWGAALLPAPWAANPQYTKYGYS